MSPETNGPQDPNVNKDVINTDIHPEGVRPFSAPLPEVAPHLDTPDDISAIDPHTGNTEFERLDLTAVTPEQGDIAADQKKSGFKKWIAGLVGGAVLVSGGAVAGKALSGSSEAAPEPTPTSTSAPETPGAPTDPNVGSAVGENEGAGLETTPTPETYVSIENVTGTPTAAEVLTATNKPVTVAEYSTPADAIRQFGNILNVFAKSGETEVVDGKVVQTPESLSEGRAILDNVFGPNLTQYVIDDDNRLRTDWSGAINFTPYPELMLHFEPIEETITDMGNGEWGVDTTEVHDDSKPNNMNRGTDRHGRIRLQNDGDRWYIIEITAQPGN